MTVLLMCFMFYGIKNPPSNIKGDETDADTVAVDTVPEEPTIIYDTLTVTHVTVTCYQPVEAQCDKDPLITADGSEINLDELKSGKTKWVAVSRDLLRLFPKDKPRRVYIDGYGVFEVHDVMHRRWNHRMDILIHPEDTLRLKEGNVRVAILV